MENMSDLKGALPAGNLKDVPTRNYYVPPATSGCARGNPLTRGGFANQRGPGRGRSRSRDGTFSPALSRCPGGTENNSNTGNVHKFVFKEPEQGAQNNKYQDTQSQQELVKSMTMSISDHKGQQNNSKPKIKNTVDFEPDHTPAEMRVLPAPAGLEKYHREITSRDVIIVSDLFCKLHDRTIYQNLLGEAESNTKHEWKLWHGDSHMISDDRTRRKQACPTFDMVISKIRDYFGMEVHATRFNWFRDTKDWKPYHHDAAAIKPEKAAVQNITVAVSFGSEREIAFQHAKNGSTVSFPLPNGTMYTFSNDVNVIWRHGVPQLPLDKQVEEGRISIVAWGWVDGVVNVGKTPALHEQ